MEADIVARTAALAGVDADAVRVAPLAYDPGSPATGGLWRVEAGATTYFVKLLRHPRLWPMLAMLPPPAQEDFRTLFPWRFELDMALSPIAALLPDGVRAAELRHHAALDDAHVLTWWEWIEEQQVPWTLRDYARAATALGRLAARRREGSTAAAETEIVPDLGVCGALRYYVERRVLQQDARTLTSADFWEHPSTVAALAEVGDETLRADVERGVVGVGAVLARLTDLPQTLAHGDASIQNLLLAPDGEIVVIDWGFGGLLPVGFDLGQLLVGGAHAGLVDPDDLPAIHETILAGYLEGLAAEEHPATREQVLLGYLGGLWVRSAFTALPYDALEAPAAAGVTRLRDRLRLTRALLTLAASVVGFEATTAAAAAAGLSPSAPADR